MSWLKKSLVLALIGFALLGSPPKEARATVGEYSYYTHYFGLLSWQYVNLAYENSRRVTQYGYYGFELSYYAYLYSYYAYYQDNAQLNHYTEGYSNYAYQASGAEWKYFGGNDYWYYSAYCSYLQMVYSVYSYTYE